MADDVLDEMEKCIDEVKESIDKEKIVLSEEKTNPEEKTSIGRKMAYCREILQFTRKEMADVFEITPSQLANYEYDISKPPLTTLLLYAKYFEIPMEDFVDDFVTIRQFRIDYCIFQFVKFKTLYKFVHNK